MRIAVLVGNYAPKASAVGNCMKNVVDCLVKEHEVTVVCLRQDDSQASSELIDGASIVRISTPMQRIRYRSERRMSGRRAPLARAARMCTRIVRVCRLALRKTALDMRLVRAYYDALCSLERMPDMLVPACLPFEAVHASAEFKRGNPEIRLVPFLFDQFADSATLYPTSALARRKWSANVDVERSAFLLSDKLLNITWLEHAESCYPELLDKFVHVEHPLLVRPGDATKEQNGSDSLVILYAGALTRGVRSPEYALAVIDRAMGIGARVDFVDFYVPGSEASAGWFTPYADEERIRLHDAVPSSEVGELYSGATWLLSIGNVVSGQKVSKVYEYMAYGRPIVHFSSIGDDETEAELRGYPLAISLRQSDPVEDSARKLYDFLTETVGKTVPFDTVANLFSDELPSVTAAEIVRGGVNARCSLPGR